MKIINTKGIRSTQFLGILLLLSGMLALSFVGKDDVKKVEMVVITTKFGDMTVYLYPETPLHKANFLKLVKDGFYKDLLFHRIIQGFMIQGGDPDSRNAPSGKMLGQGGPGYTIPAELNPKYIHKKGALAAARMGDQVNPKRASSGSQFYIVQGKPVSKAQLEKVAARRKTQNSEGFEGYSPEQIEAYRSQGGTPFLDGAYTVFGEVVEGLDVIDAIAAQPTAGGDRPEEDILMSMKIVKKKWPLPTKK